MSYLIPFTDTTKTAITVEDQSLNTDTSLTFVGKNFPGYAQSIGENFLHLLENFARSTAPSNPVQGQLWYDTGTSFSPARPQLKVFDGVKWAEAGSIKKGSVQPTSENSIAGDLWVDIVNQQLYLFTGSIWVLVGPQFSESSLSGLKAESVLDRDTNTPRSVLVLYVAGFPVIIISKDTFVPKTSIQGFEIIRQGVNMSTTDFDLDGTVLNKFWGTSEKANALVVGNSTVAASNFLRGDAVSTTAYPINVRNGAGISLGGSLETNITSNTASTIINQKTPGSEILLKIAGNEIVTVKQTTTNRVGINNNQPDAELDVDGNAKISEALVVGNVTVNFTTIPDGDGIFGNDLTVTNSLSVGNDTTITGRLTIGKGSDSEFAIGLAEVKNETHTIGTDHTVPGGKRFRTVYAKDFVGDNFTGAFTGSLTGDISGAAARLANTSAFSIRGDISSNVIPFNGAEPVPVRSIANVARSALGVATITTTTAHSYVTGYIVSVSCSNTSFNTSGSPITVTSSNTFTYANTGSTTTTTVATGSVTTNPGGSFFATLSDQVIADKTELSNSLGTDYFLVYRATATPSLRKISKSTLFSTAGLVPTGSIMPFAGDTPPSGYLLCDGSEQSQSLYPELFEVIAYKYKPSALLTGYNTFALPDLRGRFPLGKDDMDNNSYVNIEITAVGASRAAITAIGEVTATFVVKDGEPSVPGSPGTFNGPFQTGKTLEGTGLDVTAGAAVIASVTANTPSAGFTTIVVNIPPQTVTYPATSGITLTSIGTIDGGGGAVNRVPDAVTLGNVSGARQVTLTDTQLPEHTHDLKDAADNQYYAIRDITGTPPEPEVEEGNIHFTSGRGHLLKNSGGITSSVIPRVQSPVNLMNPYQTINYIIFTGRIL